MRQRLQSRFHPFRPAVVAAAIAVGGALAAPAPTARAQATRVEKVQGYAEWRKGDLLVVDGQRVRVTASTKQKLKDARDVASLPLGFEVEVEGVRAPDGTLVASRLDAKPNGSAMFEKDVLEGSDAMEQHWLQSREVTRPQGDGKTARSRIIESGPQVDRVQRLMDRLLPPYVDRERIRVHVVEDEEWNAFAMGNGSVWVHTGLLNDMDDDEVGIVLGHELAHYTHEHSRKGMRRAMWTQMAAATVDAVAAEMDEGTKKGLLTEGGLLTLAAWKNGYGRDMEDQADRVGLRYAYEGRFDVKKGPAVWDRFREKYGQQSALKNFFFGDHSQADARARNLNREIQLNYQDLRPRSR